MPTPFSLVGFFGYVLIGMGLGLGFALINGLIALVQRGRVP